MMQELVLDPKNFPDPHNDHPLNQHEDSSWHAYFQVSLQFCHGFGLLAQCTSGRSYCPCELCCLHNVMLMSWQDAEMMEQIDRDVMRTHPDMHFFSGDGEPSKRHREVYTH